MSNQTIGCSVESCKYNDGVAWCTLPSIKVGNDMNMSVEEPSRKEETECDSFEARQ